MLGESRSDLVDPFGNINFDRSCQFCTVVQNVVRSDYFFIIIFLKACLSFSESDCERGKKKLKGKANLYLFLENVKFYLSFCE